MVELKSNPINRRAWKRWFLSWTVVEQDTFLDTRRKYPLRSNVFSLIVLSKKKNLVWYRTWNRNFNLLKTNNFLITVKYIYFTYKYMDKYPLTFSIYNIEYILLNHKEE